MTPGKRMRRCVVRTSPSVPRWHAPRALVLPATALCLSGCFGSYGAVDVRPGDKSPGTAFALGFFPGFGLGHRYAGASRTANVLLATQSVGLLLFSSPGPEAAMDLCDGRLTPNEIGLIMFTGAWYYDSLRASAAARRYNKTRRRFDGIVTPVGGVGVLTF